MTPAASKVLAVLYSSGGLGDVGRHAVAAALEKPPSVISKIKVITKDPNKTLFEETNWNCGCPEGHVLTDEDKSRLEIIPFDFSKRGGENDLGNHLDGVDAIVSGLGNRQPFHGDRVAKRGTGRLIDAMKGTNIKRLVMISSIGIDDDWPPMEWRFEGKIMKWLFKTLCRREYSDLLGAERAVRQGHKENPDLNYLIIRPVGIGEKKEPVGKWYFQKEKHVDWVGPNVAKMDVARCMVQEALGPSRNCEALVIGAKPGKKDESMSDY
uniref:NAD(P)-binding domain-containing protein n=1 Tax=Helicotheca tamesis TaxID=374047 RepID=A0A7S2GSY8_9STRA|mmetsp:Transcript_10366/g.14501  ORF Transcript_10366/g.14501 Transcript_10366/m.14501 type:complete len:267 (+) Transcript_10366:282-1082(+)|eukprot:CAMPEP_0185739052 /NCGR_PEP_ID=MMETSP1171-20130828/34475_1 /TAXON_ID=374046 /ORGANISM="Helicotheca tamensis, Strain CCMP826" /LENGTH=266 /DNA_ID=CAMNT_0028410483 /DNA_START=213 /DNA_END=1013 /DNA_ORIENTATION=+